VAVKFDGSMHLRRSRYEDRDALFDVWLRSVRATHGFVAEADIETFMPLVREYLASDAEIWTLAPVHSPAIGFMGLAGNRIESLFLAPEWHRRGWGRRLVDHARTLRGALAVDVNEQNVGAVAFYRTCGFSVIKRSDVDDMGRPYPLIHMRMESL
jgi:putative acetyltransferase